MDKENQNDINKDINDSEKTENTIPEYIAPDEETLKKQNKKKKQAVVVIVAVSVLALLLIAVIIVCVVKLNSSDSKSQPTETVAVISEVQPELTDVAQTEILTEETLTKAEESSEITNTESSSVSVVAEEKPKTTNKATPGSNKKPKKEEPTIEGLPPLTQTGDNILSDSPDNKYIKAVCEKYGVSSDNVVAIYAIPDKGNNFVLEFDGTKDSSGKIIKSPDTLLKVHQIDIKGNIKTATGKKQGNVGVSYYEGLMVFYMVTNIVMPQYPDYFTGVK